MDTFEQAFMEGFVEGMDKMAKKRFRLGSQFRPKGKSDKPGFFSRVGKGAKKAGKGYLSLMSGSNIAKAGKKAGRSAEKEGGRKASFLKKTQGKTLTPSQMQRHKGRLDKIKSGSKKRISVEKLKSGAAIGGTGAAATGTALGLKALLSKKD